MSREPTRAEMEELADWIASRPPVLQALLERFPPACYVVAKPDQRLICPAPGVTGIVEAYHEKILDDGAVQLTMTVATGEWAGECFPEWLDVVDSDEQFELFRRAKAMRP